MAKESSLETKFRKAWEYHHPAIPIVTQHVFHPVRKWRFDFAFPEAKLAIEIQGYGAGHASYSGMRSDYHKHNSAVARGWVILYFMSSSLSPKMIDKTIGFVAHMYEQKTGLSLKLSDQEKLQAWLRKKKK